MGEKILVKADNPCLVDIFLSNLSKEKNKKIVKCRTFEMFFSTVMQVNLFENDSEGRIVCFYNLLEENFEDIKRILENIGEIKDIIVLVYNEELYKGNIKEVQAFFNSLVLRKVCTFIELKNPEEQECISIVEKFLKDKNIKYEKNVPSFIGSMFGKNITRLYSELNKIKDFYSEDNSNEILSKEQCELICSTEVDVELFGLVDLFFRKKAIEFFNSLSTKDISFCMGLIQFLMKQVENLYKVSTFREMGLSIYDISKFIGLPIFVVKKMMSYLIYYNKDSLVVLLDILNKVNVEIRNRDISKNLLIESYLLKASKV